MIQPALLGARVRNADGQEGTLCGVVHAPLLGFEFLVLADDYSFHTWLADKCVGVPRSDLESPRNPLEMS